MTTPVYDPPRGANSFLVYVIACVAGIGLVVWRYVDDLAGSIRTATVTLPVRFAPTAQVPQPPGGAEVRADQATLRVATSDVPAGAMAYVRVGDAVELVAVSVLIALVAVVAWKLSRGGLFDRSTARILDLVGIAAIVAGFVPDFVRRMGWNWIVSGLGWDGRLPEPVVTTPWVPLYVGLLVIICFRFAIRAAQPMVRDQSGLV